MIKFSKKNISGTNRGFSVVELLFAVVIAGIVGLGITLFARNIINYNTQAQANMTATLESRKVLRVMVRELRSAIPSALGSYTIESAATSSIVFFADVNFDDVADKIRYFLNPTTHTIERGVILASGNPPGYTGGETLSTLMNRVYNDSSIPVFDYYDGTYTGSSAALSVPVNIPVVRLVKVTAVVQIDPRTASLATTTSQAALRNLKDNL